jgi:hypothetical protein
MNTDINQLIAAVVEVVKANQQIAERILTLAEAVQPTRPTPEPTKQEAEILEVFEPGAILTGRQIAKMIGLEYSGSLRDRLSQMVQRGLLENKSPGYSLRAP